MPLIAIPTPNMASQSNRTTVLGQRRRIPRKETSSLTEVIVSRVVWLPRGTAGEAEAENAPPYEDLHPSCDIRPNLASTFTLSKSPVGNSPSRRPQKHQYRLPLVDSHSSAAERRSLVSKCPTKGVPTSTNHSPRIQMRSDYSN